MSEQWRQTQLGKVCEIILGQSPSSNTYNQERIGLPFFQGKSEFGGKYAQVKTWCSDPLKVAKKEDILISVRAPVGESNLAPENCCIGRGLAALRADQENLLQEFLWHQIDFKKGYLQGISQGSTFDAISGKDLSELELELPPLPEQKKIAEILSGIDLRIKLGTQRITQLETLLRSLGDKFFGHQSHHETKTIGQIFEVSSGTTPSRSRQDYFCTNGGTPWVKTMDLTDDYVRTTDEQLTSTGMHEGRARILPKGTLLIAMYGGWNQIGRTGILTRDSSCNQAMSALLPAIGVSPEFLNLQLVIRRSYWKGVAASSRKDPNITKSDVTDMPIAVPADHIQAEITKALSSVIHQKRTEYSYLQNLNLLKNALASDLLSGRKRVSI